MKTNFLLAAALASLLLFPGNSRANKKHIIYSGWIHGNDTVLVYSPAGAEYERALPTVFLLHGYSGSYADWGNSMNLQKLADETGFRIICPDGFFQSWYFNDVNPLKMQWREFFWFDLWPLVSRMYGLDPDRTFITGLSMGGHGAMNVFLDHPDRFRGAGSMSGVLDLRHSAGSRTTIPQILGGRDIDDPRCTAQSAVNRLERIRQTCGSRAGEKLLVVTCGEQDETFLPASTEFVERCKALNLNYIEKYAPGRHEWAYWTEAIHDHLTWFREALPTR